MRTTRLVAAVLVAALLAAAACGGGDDDEAGDNAGKAAARTTATTDEPATTTTTRETTTTDTAGSTTTTEPTGLAAGPEYVTTEGPSGSGCTPGETTELPGGWWAGEVTSVQSSSIDFDLVCFFSGGAATQAATEDGNEATNDYYIRNNNSRTFRVGVTAGAPATCVGMNASPFACDAEDVLTLYRTTGATATSVLDGTSLSPVQLIWVHVGADGSSDYLYMQYAP